METPFALLWFAAKTAVRVVGVGAAADLIVDVAPALWRDFKKVVGLGDNEAANDISASIVSRPDLQKKVNEQLEAVAQAPPDELRKLIKEIVKEVAGNQTKEVRQAVASYLAKVPASVRRNLQRDNDPTGTTVPPDLVVIKPEDLLSFLPPLQEPAACPPAADRPVRVTLTATAGIHLGHSYSFEGHDTFLVGRGDQAHFRLPSGDRFFSRTHFMVEVNPPRCSLMDLGSRNGTHVNGQRVQSVQELKDGDTIKAGHTIFQVRLEELSPELPPPQRATVEFVPERPAPRAATAGGLCPVCQAPLHKAATLCPACRALAGTQEQPIAGYQIIRELGRGGMGVVHLAVREADNSVVALKTITPAQAGSAKQVDRFLREACILQQLDHPLIVAFRDMGTCDDLLYFAMAYVPGIDAAQRLKKDGPLPVGRAVVWIGQLLQALDYAHAKGFVHRDIKPANLLIVDEGGQEKALLADFGLARVYQASTMSGLTLRGDVAGTMAYMAPEQITQFRESKPGVDQYSAAASLYNLLTGKMIFDLPKDYAQRLLTVLHQEPIPILQRRPDLPAALAQTVHRALAKDPHQRFADARAFRLALMAAQ